LIVVLTLQARVLGQPVDALFQIALLFCIAERAFVSVGLCHVFDAVRD
jgi:hypothetical protein